MIPLSPDTWLAVEAVFPEKDRRDAADLLERECGDQVPFCADLKPADMERIRFAVIKLSKGHIREMPQWIKLARTDWRDLFMAADFGYHIDEHRKWFADMVGHPQGAVGPGDGRR